MTPSFTYSLTPSIQFGCRLASNIGEELISICTEKRVLIISDSGVIAAGLGIGTLEQYGAHIFGIGYQQAIAVLLLLLVLIYRLAQQRRVRQVLQ